jgi:sialate O-acetylesterase
MMALIVLTSVFAGGCAAVPEAPEAAVERIDGDVRLPAVFGSNMVVQRDRPIQVWGWAQPGQEVGVWLANRHGSAVADETGKWQTTLGALRAGGPHRMVVAGDQAYALDNVMVGEVWLCSGQSNMQWTVKQSANPDEEIAAGSHPNIRMITVPRRPAVEPQDDVDAAWVVASPQTVGNFSAVAYYFGRTLQDELNVPIGLIHSSWGGTLIEPWTPRQAFLDNEEALGYVGGDVPEKLGNADRQAPTALYNGMIAPLAPYTIRGAIWYQGESNISRAYQYETFMATLIEGWRKVWYDKAGDTSARAQRDRDFPFYLVQLAPFNYQSHPSAMAELREAQLRTVRNVPRTGMAVTTDVGNLGEIHPKNKQDVGRRLALWALANDYGQRGTVYSGPLYRAMAVEDDAVRVSFDHVGGGLVARDGPLKWWQIAGEDGTFVEAVATIEGDTVVVRSDEVRRPVAVRFGWHHGAEPNFFNEAGLPASPFRTDDLKKVTQP